MENKINIAELLKDCPKGMELDCAIWDNCTFDGIEDEGYINILVKTPNGQIKLSKEGCFAHNCDSAKCVIFPKGKTTWEGFQRPFKDGDILAMENECGVHIFIYNNTTNEYNGYGYYVILTSRGNFKINKFCNGRSYRLATEEEKQKLFQAIKDNDYKWNAETKTLEKLIEPKFKVGDEIKYKNGKNIDGVEQGVILSITDEVYDVAVTNNMGVYVSIAEQDDWELAPRKFDINTLKPFDSKVLVRSSMDGLWKPAVFGFRNGYNDNAFYIVGGSCWKQCIPYLNNEHLCGTTNDCDEFYKTW